jgi:thiamine-phosphate pyrophosphorylase
LLPAHNHPIVCYVTNRQTRDSSSAIPDLLARIRVAIAAGVDWMQIREKDLTARELLDLTRAAIAIAREELHGVHGAAWIIVNDRLDVALAAGAAGVHLGRSSVPAREAIRWLRTGNASPDFLVGVSCHSIEEIRQAEDAGAGYAFFGPVFDTPSKRSFGPPQEVARLEEACRSVQIPVIAIGGVDENSARECIQAGAAGIAAIRIFQQEEASTNALKETIARLHQLP